jgi:hypothetical protein
MCCARCMSPCALQTERMYVCPLSQCYTVEPARCSASIRRMRSVVNRVQDRRSCPIDSTIPAPGKVVMRGFLRVSLCGPPQSKREPAWASIPAFRRDLRVCTRVGFLPVNGLSEFAHPHTQARRIVRTTNTGFFSPRFPMQYCLQKPPTRSHMRPHQVAQLVSR